jgi:phosphoribosylformylglycinamidine cyclo-ligase
MALIRSAVEVRGLAHITSGGLENLLRLDADVTYEISEPLEPGEIFRLIAERASVADEEMHQVFNMGCGFCVVVPEGDEREAVSVLGEFHPGTRRIGSITTGGRAVVRAN